MRWAGGLLVAAGLAGLVALAMADAPAGWSIVLPVASLGAGVVVLLLGHGRQALHESEERFRIVARVTNDAVWDWDLVADEIAWNEGLGRLFGYAAHEVQPDSMFWTRNIHPDDHDRVVAGIRAVHAGRDDAWRDEYRFRRSNGDFAWVLDRGYVIRDAQGRAVRMVGGMTDLTARRHAERLDAGQRELLTGIAARVPLAQTLAAVCRLYEEQHPHSLCTVLVLDEAGTHVHVGAAPSMPDAFNDAIDGEPIGPAAGSCGTAAWRVERVVVTDIETDPLWDRYRELAHAHGLRACWSTPVLSSARGVLATFAVYYREPRAPDAEELRAIDGLAAVTAIAIEQDADYRRLMRSEQRFRSLFDEHPDAVYSLDLDGRFTSYNRSFHALSGFRNSDIFGTTFDRRIAPAQRDEVRAQFAAAAGGEARTYEASVLLPDDGRIELRITNLPIVEDGEVTGVFGIAHDITERRRAEQALQLAFEELRLRNRELQDFAFVASHDLQEPLRKIQAFSDRLQSRYAAQLDLEARDYLDRSAQAAARMQKLIDDLLAYSRVSSRGKPFAPVDLGRLAAGVVDDLEARLESSGGRVEIGPLPTIEGDATQLQQLLQNLVANALKFRSPERAPVVRIEASPARLPPDRAAWELRVSDNGIGFDPKYAERIFAPFQRLHARQEYEGTGIGLAIVRRIVERHRGTVHAEPRAEGGATFTVLLPAQSSHPARESAA